MKPQLEDLMKVLAHKIRTPLSIIQNELACIKGKVTEEEYDRILTACKNINTILKEEPLSLISGNGSEENE